MSLSEQLAARNTLDSARLASQQSLKNPPSFIYTPRHAATVTTTDLHSIAANAWDQLSAIDPFFERYQSKIFGEEAKGTDRSGLTKAENDKLDLVLEKVLRALGKHMLLKPAGIVLEWLVRRFRVNDLNIPALVALFLPYHTTSHFPSALALISQPNLLSTPFSALIPARTSLAPLPLPDLIALLPPFSSVTTSHALLSFILRLPLPYLEAEEKPHRALIGFWLQVVAGYLERAGSTLPEGEKAAVLSTILEVVQLSRTQPDTLIAAYILLARYSLHYPFSAETSRVVMKTVVGNRAKRDVMDEEMERAFLTTLVVVAQLGGGEIEVKEGKKFLGTSGWKALMRIDNLSDMLVELCNQYNAERFMKPFLATLAAESITDEHSLGLLSSLLTPRDLDTPLLLPTPIVSFLTSSTLTALLASSSTTLLPILNKVYQRWPVVYSSLTTSHLASTAPADLPHLTQILNAVLTGGTALASSGSTTFLASESPDLALRVLALKDLLESTELLESNPAFVHDTLLARLTEPVAKIAEVLYSPAGIKVLQAVLGAEETLETLVRVLETKNLDAGIAAKVLAFLAGPYVVQNPEKSGDVVKRVFWGRILNGPNAALKGSKLAEQAWIKGAVSFDASVEGNVKVVERIAKNLAGLDETNKADAAEFLLAQIEVSKLEKDADEESSYKASSSLLALLVAAQLAPKLDEAPRITFVTSLHAALYATERSLDALAGSQPEVILDGPSLAPLVANAIFSRPQSAKTLRRTRAALLLSAIAAVRPVASSSWSWLAGSDEAYARLAQSIYRLAHTGTTAGAAGLAGTILSALFTTIVEDDTLAFLAKVWTTESVQQLRVSALRDAAVFVKVQAMPEMGKVVDFQVVVPAVLVALMDAEKKVRQEAMQLLAVLRETIPASTAEVYGKDVFYGAAPSGSIKYLDVVDTARYVQKLLDSRNEIVMDGGYLLTFHQSILEIGEQETKKARTLKFKAFTFIISHVASWPSVQARTLLLRSISGIQEGAKGALLVPILAEAVADKEGSLFAQVEDEVVVEYCRLLLQPFESASKKWIEASENRALETFSQTLEIVDVAGFGATLRKEALLIVRSNIFSVVRGDSRIDLFRRLVRLATVADAPVASDVLACLRACKVDADTVTAFLNEIRLSIASPVSKGAKRGRTSVPGPSRVERLPELVVVLESVEFKTVPASHSLLLTLFDLLSTLIEVSTAAPVDIQYPGQLMLSTLSKVIENVKPTSGVTSDSIRMTPVLDLMRSSVNPQTSHQALLLLAQLGPLVPDQLVHNIMPIFTFMGANVLQRDDAYSLRVVERTLESIVPALVKSMKRSSANRDALVADLKELLRVFTDAAAHVPRHRRIKLFVRFVETLGADEFLSPVSLLLLDKSIKAVDTEALLLAIFEGFPVEVQLSAIKHALEEVPRLLLRGTGNAAVPFLDLPAASEVAGQELASAKEQVLNVVNFVALSLEAKQLSSKVDAARAAGNETVDTALSELVRALLDISTVSVPAYSASDKADLATSTNYGLQAAVRLMSTQAFSEAILWLLDLADDGIQSSALALLRTRLPAIKPTRRGDISPAVVNVVERIRVVMLDSKVDSDGALETLDVIAESVWAEEDLVLAKTVPDLIAVAGATGAAKSTRMLAMSIVKKLSNRLGPRLIPLVAKITPFAVQVLRQEAQTPLSITPGIVSTAFEILEGLFTSIPTFIGAQLDKVFEAALSSDILSLTEDKDSVGAKARAQLLSTAAKKLPAKTLYPAIIRLHASLDGTAAEPILGLLDLLNRALRQGKTSDIAENYRPIFKLFLTIFDLRRVHSPSLSSDDINQIEENALGAFTQFILKLNEQMFRPLFLRTYDWAVIDLADEEDAVMALTARRTVLYKLVDRLLSQLKSIVVPYFSFMLDQTIELLGSFASGDLRDTSLWIAVTSATTKALEFDETGFWTPLRLGKLSTPIANQLSSPHPLPSALITSSFHPLLAAYAQALLPHDTLLKNLNTSLLMLTRSDDLRVKRNALEGLEQLWDALGDGMLGSVPETTPFLAETIEETEGGVEMVTRRLVSRIEEHLGESLSSYLEN